MQLELEQPKPLLSAEDVARNQFQTLLETFQAIVVKTLTNNDISCVPIGQEVH